ncbi:MAG: Stp1/IreP family PP2C-type Ser/Thr phosphatase [Oscillospiraceae bacterium]|nr:Stp1/IreP family PP2C-type Ser/Thr phosphatase [Oscillospiraceae bacterium]
MRIYGMTDIGLVREENQDSFAITDFENGIFAVLCDGMGGHSSGKEAGELACSVIMDKFKSQYSPNFSLSSVRNLMFSCVNAANSAVFAESVKNPAKAGMGTTCVTVFRRGSDVLVVNVGDSRAYLSTKENIRQITDDHTVVRMLLENGEISAEEAHMHPQQSCLTMAVGVERNISPDYFEVTVDKDDIVLMCSDGLTRYCTDNEIHDIINCNSLESLPALLIERANSHGGRDNITVVVFSE